MSGEDRPAGPTIDEFLGEPTRELSDWRWLWAGDRPFPIRSHRGAWGRLLVACKRLLRPFVKAPQNDLWERQRVFNLILLEHLEELAQQRERLGRMEHRLEGFLERGVGEIMRHNDALFTRVDQKLDRYRRQAEVAWQGLGAALAALEGGDPGPLARSRQERSYVGFEERFRGTEAEIRERIGVYLPFLRGRGEILDLGCGRGEALAVLRENGLEARGVDSNAEMVARCRQRGLEAREADLFDALADTPEGSLGAVVSLHVVEHLPPESLDRLVRLAWRALGPGGVLVAETPNPLSVVVAARNFWRDSTHWRPVHPDSLEHLFRTAGFDPVERLELSPFPERERLPEIDLRSVPEEQRPLADGINRLRDRLDELLFGHQDYGMVGIKPEAGA